MLEIYKFHSLICPYTGETFVMQEILNTWLEEGREGETVSRLEIPSTHCLYMYKSEKF